MQNKKCKKESSFFVGRHGSLMRSMILQLHQELSANKNPASAGSEKFIS